MKLTRAAALLAGLVLATTAFAGCSSSGGGSDPLPPIIKSVDELQDATVKITTKEVLSIDTGSLPTDSYTAEIADPSIAKFTQGTQGASSSDESTNPGIEPLAEGTTKVTLTNVDGGVQPLTFTVEVVAP